MTGIRVVGNPDPSIVEKTLNTAIGYSHSQRFIKSRESAVIFYKNSPVGVIVFTLYDDYVYINSIGVLDEMRRKGFGRALIEYCEEVARNNNKKYIEVVPVNNSESFYKKLGFENSKEEEFIMRKYI